MGQLSAAEVLAHNLLLLNFGYRFNSVVLSNNFRNENKQIIPRAHGLSGCHAIEWLRVYRTNVNDLAPTIARQAVQHSKVVHENVNSFATT